jgi:hypothetical protein
MLTAKGDVNQKINPALLSNDEAVTMRDNRYQNTLECEEVIQVNGSQHEILSIHTNMKGKILQKKEGQH